METGTLKGGRGGGHATQRIKRVVLALGLSVREQGSHYRGWANGSLGNAVVPRLCKNGHMRSSGRQKVHRPISRLWEETF